MIHYSSDLSGVQPEMLVGFCVGWKHPLSGERLLRLLGKSFAFELAWSDQQLVGFVQAISDGDLFAFIPLLEVRPEFQGRGIGTELMRRLMVRLHNLYGIDLVCDADIAAFYERLGMTRVNGMCVRNFSALACT